MAADMTPAPGAWPAQRRAVVDGWKFYDITHRNHVICNPMSHARLDEVIGLLDLPPRPRVLDVGSGKGEFVVRMAERWGGAQGEGFGAVAIDISPFFVAEFRRAAANRVPRAALEILEQDAAAYSPAPASFDLASCVGATWVYGGYEGTLSALAAAVRPGGQVLVGEPFWRREPDPAYLEASGMHREEFGTHASNVSAGQDQGLVPLFAFVSTDEEWDRYETLQWLGSARYAAAHPDDPDLPEVMDRVERSRREYLTWGRDTLGWALYLFRRP